jgi:hypothetical protein
VEYPLSREDGLKFGAVKNPRPFQGGEKSTEEFIPYLAEAGLKLREDAPEEIKKKFEEWLKELKKREEETIKVKGE